MVKVPVSCDYCSIIFERYIAKYHNTREESIVKKDACESCKPQLRREVLHKTYGTNSPMQVESIKNKAINNSKKKYTVEKVREIFLERGYTLISNTYKNAHSHLDYLCPSHPDELKCITLHSLLRGEGCFLCGNERKTGRNNVNWTGNKDIGLYLRNVINEWKLESLKIHEYKCIISGVKSSELHVHHLKSFTAIVNETLKELKITKRDNIEEYSDEELLDIRELFIRKNNEILGVPIMPVYHNDFHNKYGKGNNTPEQFEEYKLHIKGEM